MEDSSFFYDGKKSIWGNSDGKLKRISNRGALYQQMKLITERHGKESVRDFTVNLSFLDKKMSNYLRSLPPELGELCTLFVVF